jgi:hypothetical protein
MRRAIACAAAAALLLWSAAPSAATFHFQTDPFAGSTALTTPGRQIVGGEDFITFNIATDVFAFNPAVFGINQLVFANDLVENLPTSGVNVIVLQTQPIPFAAGLAANLIAAQITTPGPGFFIYFNSGLDLPRLVFSTDLSDNTADLRVLARMTNLSGQAGRDLLPTFTAANFALVPEPSTLSLVLAPLALWLAGLLVREGWLRR